MTFNNSEPTIVGAEISAAIRQLIEEASETHQVIHCEAVAARLAEEHPDSGVTADQIRQRLQDAAMSSGVPLQIGPSA